MPYAEFPYSGPIEPGKFHGRRDIIDPLCQHLDARASVSLVGGPLTGADSLMHYLVSDHARGRHPSLQRTVNVFVPTEPLGTQATPGDFWRRVFRSLARKLPDRAKPWVDAAEVRARAGALDVYDLEDLFDQLADAGLPVVLFLGDIHNLLDNDAFWPPDDFFHIARALARRNPRGLQFVTNSPRPLLDLWDDSRAASPFYNVLQTIPIGRLSLDDCYATIRRGFESLGVDYQHHVAEFIAQLAQRHPCMVNYIAGLVVDLIRAGQPITQAAVTPSFVRPDAPTVLLAERITKQLTPNERTWADRVMGGEVLAVDHQIHNIQSLWDFGLTPLGMSRP